MRVSHFKRERYEVSDFLIYGVELIDVINVELIAILGINYRYVNISFPTAQRETETDCFRHLMLLIEFVRPLLFFRTFAR